MAKFRLADVERPDTDPFEVEGTDDNHTVYTLAHPMSLHYDDIMQIDLANPARSIQILLGDQHDKFVSDEALDGFALEALFRAWSEHYDIPLPGEAVASPRPSNGTARRSKRTSRSGSTTRAR